VFRGAGAARRSTQRGEMNRYSCVADNCKQHDEGCAWKLCDVKGAGVGRRIEPAENVGLGRIDSSDVGMDQRIAQVN
jgi:hypothetical protein